DLKLGWSPRKTETLRTGRLRGGRWPCISSSAGVSQCLPAAYGYPNFRLKQRRQRWLSFSTSTNNISRDTLIT
ncbi:hypothetical protein NDU88_008488, partial [Pleurodeles waltl]